MDDIENKKRKFSLPHDPRFAKRLVFTRLSIAFGQLALIEDALAWMARYQQAVSNWEEASAGHWESRARKGLPNNVDAVEEMNRKYPQP